MTPPWQADAYNQSEDFEYFQVAPLSNRKNKPLAPQPVPSDGNSSEILDYPSGFGPEAFFYDIDLDDDDVFGLFDFDSTYSLDESATIPHNVSFLELESASTVNTTLSEPVSKQEHLHSQPDLSLPWTMSQLAQVETNSSWTLIPTVAMNPGETGVQMNQRDLKSLSGQTVARTSLSGPERSPTRPVDMKLTSTVPSSLSEAAATEDTFKITQHGQKKTKLHLVETAAVETLAGGYVRTSLIEFSLTDTTPVISSSNSRQSSLHYLPDQTILPMESLAVSRLAPQGSYPLSAETYISSLSPARSIGATAGLLMDSVGISATPSSHARLMPTAGVQSDFLMTKAIRPSLLSPLQHSDVFPSLTPGSVQSLGIFDANNNTDPVLPSLKNPLILSAVDSSHFPTPTSYPGIESAISTSIAHSQSKLDSALALEPSHVNSLAETFFKSSNGRGDVNPSEVELRNLSHVPHNSVSGNFELPYSSAVALTDEWRASQSSPLNSAFQTKVEKIDASPTFGTPAHDIFGSERVSLASPGDYKAWRTASEIKMQTTDSQVSPLEIFPSHTVFFDELSEVVPSRPEEASAYESVFRYQSEAMHISNFVEHMISMTYGEFRQDSFVVSDASSRASSPTHTDAFPASSEVPSRSFKKYAMHDANGSHTNLTNLEQIVNLSSGFSQLNTERAVTIRSQETLQSHTQHTPAFQQFPTFSSSRPKPSELEMSAQIFVPVTHPTKSMDAAISSGDRSENLPDTEHVHSPTTKQPFWYKNESANPSGQGHNVPVVQSATADSETHPSPAIDDQSFVPANGTGPLLSPTEGAGTGSGATHETTAEPRELASCPCKAPFPFTCLCGLSAGNSMFSNRNLELRERV